MPYLTYTELQTHAYNEVMVEITRGNDDMLGYAITAAIEEAKGYLSGYDIETIFAQEGTDRNAILHLYVKDIAIWHLITLCNVSLDYQQGSTVTRKPYHGLEKFKAAK